MYGCYKYDYYKKIIEKYVIGEKILKGIEDMEICMLVIRARDASPL